MRDRDFGFEKPNYDAVLPSGGDFTDQPFQEFPPEYIGRRLSAVCTYTPNASAANSQAKFMIGWRINGVEYLETFIDASSPTISDPNAEVPQYILVVRGPKIAGSDAPINFRMLSYEVPAKCDAVRVLAAEMGDAAHPGSVKINLAISDAI